MGVKNFHAITKYFGFTTVVIEWLGFLICASLYTPDWSEPVSQFGYYEATRVAFGVTFTLAAISYYLFSLHLNAYWKYTSRFAAISGACFIVVGWIPYEPYAQSFIFDTHNIMIVIAVLLYALPILFIGYKKAHHLVSRISRILFYALFVLVAWSLIARMLNIGIIYAQLLSILPFHAWIIIVNKLLLDHHKEVAPGYTGKL